MKYRITSIFGVIFLFMALPLAYLFLIVIIAWNIATAWHDKIYKNNELDKEDLK